MEHRSGKLDNLANELIEQIKKRSNFFERLTIIVPSVKTSQYFKSYWLKTQNDVLMNVSFKTIDKAINDCINRNKYNIANKNVLKIVILSLIYEGKIKYDEISKYIEDTIRSYDFADILANLFIKYDEECIELSGWQKELSESINNRLEELNYITVRNALMNNECIFKEREYIFFGFSQFNELQKLFINKIDKNCDLYILEKDDEIQTPTTVISASSKLREIEAIHSEISSILLANPSAKYSDFLVLANNIWDYKSNIKTVFNQDNINFPNLIYSDFNEDSLAFDTHQFITKFMDIVNRGIFTRSDFADIVNLNLVKNARSITNEQNEEFKQAILKMRVYSSGETSDDWQYAKKRILLSKVVDQNDIDNNIVALKDDKYMPFSSIGLDDDGIIKFIKIIDDMNTLIDLCKNADTINSKSLDCLQLELEKWLSIKDNKGIELNNSFIKINQLFNEFKNLIVFDKVPFIHILLALKDCSILNSKQAPLFSQGISFTNYDEKSIVSAKYIFVLGMDNASLPKVEHKNELDLRTKVISKEERLQPLYILRQNATEHLFLSYTNKDLVSDATIYPSEFIYQLKNNKNNIIQDIEIGIDENRNWDKLFTKREFKNKDRQKIMLNSDDIEIETPEPFEIENSSKVKLSTIAKFIREPFSTKAANIYGKNYNNDEINNEEFEPFDTDNVDVVAIMKTIIVEMIKNGGEYDENKLKDKIKSKHVLALVDKNYSELFFDEVKQYCNDFYNLMLTNGKPEYVVFDDLQLNDPKPWTLICDLDVFRTISEENYCYYHLPVNFNKFPLFYNFLYPYVSCLMDIASKNEDKIYSVSLYFFTYESNIEFTISPIEAQRILSKIYQNLNDYDDIYAFPLSFLAKSSTNNSSDFNAKMSYLRNSIEWISFKDRNLYDLYTEIGYSEDDFLEQYEKRVDAVKELISKII